MDFYQYQLKNPVNINSFKKKSIIIPKNKNINYNLYNNYMTNYNQNFDYYKKLISKSNENDNNSYNMKSFIKPESNIYKDINILRIKMDYEMINQKINNMENIIQSLNNQAINIDETDDIMNKIYLRDKIRHENELSKNNQNYLSIKKSFENFEYNQNINPNHHNYSSQNIKKERYSHNLINHHIERNSFYNNNSLRNQKVKTLTKSKYSSCNDLNALNIKIRRTYNKNEDVINNNYNKSSDSLNNTLILNKKNIVQKKLIKNNNFFDKLNKISKINSYKNKTQDIAIPLQNQYKNFMINKQIINNNIDDKNSTDNKNNSEYFGSFDDYFLSDYNQEVYQNKTERNQNNNKIVKVNIVQKKAKNRNTTNFNVYNIIKNDKFIQNNYYGIKDNQVPINNSNLIIENQNSMSFFINKKKELNNNYQNNLEKKSYNKESNKDNFTKNQLQKCLNIDLFIPNKIGYEIKNNNNVIIEKDNAQTAKSINDNINNKKIKNNKENKNNIGRFKDDFYYDLYAEKIINITKINNSYDEIQLLPKIKKKYNDKFNKTLKTNINNPKNINKKKSVKFSEENNRIIKINQNDISSKFIVYNNSGKKIYHQKFNIYNYINKLKNKNLKMKSILINKKEEIIEDSEWNKLYDIINKIAQKNNNKNNNDNSFRRTKFNIKNIESFKKNKNKNIKIKK